MTTDVPAKIHPMITQSYATMCSVLGIEGACARIIVNEMELAVEGVSKIETFTVEYHFMSNNFLIDILNPKGLLS